MKPTPYGLQKVTPGGGVTQKLLTEALGELRDDAKRAEAVGHAARARKLRLEGDLIRDSLARIAILVRPPSPADEELVTPEQLGTELGLGKRQTQIKLNKLGVKPRIKPSGPLPGYYGRDEAKAAFI